MAVLEEIGTYKRRVVAGQFRYNGQLDIYDRVATECRGVAVTIDTFFPNRIFLCAADNKRQLMLAKSGVDLERIYSAYHNIDMIQSLAADGVVKGGVVIIDLVIPCYTSRQTAA